MNKPRTPDPVKAMIAQAVQYQLVTGAARPPLPTKPDDVEEVEGQIISPTETLMRIKTYDHGIRYFRVKVSEMM